MKKILLLSFIIMPFISKSQIKDTSFSQVDEKLRKASVEMIKFDRQFHMGIMFEIFGGIISFGSTQVKDGTPIAIGGGILAFVGFIIEASSSTHIKNAGIILRGNSLIVPIGIKRRIHH